MLVSACDVFKSFGEKEIFSNVNFNIDDGKKIGLIGENGAGKTTLIKLILGIDGFDGGILDVKKGISIGYLAQNTILESEFTIYEELKQVFKKELKLIEDVKNMTSDLSDPEIMREYSRKQQYLESLDAYNVDVKIKTMLNKMGFEDKSFDTKVSTLSGGEKTRLSLTRLLLSSPDLLILDEPTNHLDFRTLMWLEDYLKEYKGAVLIVSHDRYFLDKIVSQIFELEDKKLKCYKGNYSKYLVLKEEEYQRQLKEYKAQQEEIAKLEEYVAKNIVRASTSKSAKSRQKILDKMEIIEKPKRNEKRAKLSFGFDLHSFNDVLSVKDATIEIGGNTLCEGVCLEVKRGEKIGIIGENGIGKSTFLKMLCEKVPCLKGKIEWGRNVSISYFDQEGKDLNPENTVMEELWKRHRTMNETGIRTILGSVLLTGDDVYKKVGVISGGERAKLTFAILSLEKGNVLILDEPTNHLDLKAKEVLEKALDEYDGTIIMVSHDRYLLDKIPTKIFEIKKSGATLYNGKFSDYIILENQNKEEIKPQEKKTITSENKNSYKGKEGRKEKAKKLAEFKKAEQDIAFFEEKIEELSSLMEQKEVYSDYEKMAECCLLLEEYKEKLSEAT
ncbi:MAG: ABC-F family ATP-binding cassette domain-containing protein, partial [Clostridia bacterium]|nr:ABC-F family ATP-binding cassette domain-containing protein [Clostridia bacterium]